MGDRALVERVSKTAADDLHRHVDVVEQRLFGNRLEKLPPYRIDRPGRPRGRRNEPLGLSNPFFYGPVDSYFGLDVRVRGLAEGELSADAADRRVREVRHELPHGVRVEILSGVSEDDDFPDGEFDAPVERIRFAPALRYPRETDPRMDLPPSQDRRLAGRERVDDGVGSVGRAVGDDDDLELLRRIVLREEVFDSLPDARLLVPRGDHDRHERLGGRAVLPHGPRAQTRPYVQHERIARVGIEDESERKPEKRFHRNERSPE